MSSGEEALACARSRWFDLVLLDFLLGDVTGDAMIAPLRNALGESSAIVMMSAYAEARQSSIESGADVFLHKPLGAHVIQVHDRAHLHRHCTRA